MKASESKPWRKVPFFKRYEKKQRSGKYKLILGIALVIVESTNSGGTTKLFA